MECPYMVFSERRCRNIQLFQARKTKTLATPSGCYMVTIEELSI
jgi:hypothetical protein